MSAPADQSFRGNGGLPGSESSGRTQLSSDSTSGVRAQNGGATIGRGRSLRRRPLSTVECGCAADRIRFEYDEYIRRILLNPK